MKLTGNLLTRLELSLRVTLTPEQRVIMLYWYGHEPRHGWDEDDFVLGISEVMKHYPDHRPEKPSLQPGFSRECEPKDEPL